MQTKSNLLPQKITILLLLAIWLIQTVPEPCQAALDHAQNISLPDLTKKITAAYGGIKKLKLSRYEGYRSHEHLRITSGVSSAANELECDITGQGDKVLIETNLLGQKTILGFDGKKSWSKAGNWVSPSTETTAKQIVDELNHGLNLLLDIAEGKRKITLIGTKPIMGKSCVILKVIADDGKPTTFYVDKSNHLVLRSEYMSIDPEQGIPALQSTNYCDYRMIDGSPTPFKTIEYSNNKKSVESIIDKIELGLALDDKIFEMPPESVVAGVKDNPVTIPFELIGNEIILKVRVNNQEDLKFILDTGSSQTVLDKEIANTIGSVSTENFSVTSGSKAIPLTYLTLDKIALGAPGRDVTIDNVTALVSDISSFEKMLGERPSGLIGSNILRRFLVTIDYPNKQLILANPINIGVNAGANVGVNANAGISSNSQSNTLVIPTSPTFGTTALIVSGKINGKKDLDFLVDTGAAFNNIPQSIARNLYSGSLLPIGEIVGIDGHKLSIGSIKFNTLKIGGLTLTSPVFAMSPHSANDDANGFFTNGSIGILGNPIWSQFKMTIDYRNEKLILVSPLEFSFLESTKTQLDQINKTFLRTKNLDQTIKAYQEIIDASAKRDAKAAQSVALAASAEIYAEKSQKTKDTTLLTYAIQQFEQASKLAHDSNDRNVEGEVLARWANFYLSTPAYASDAITAQALLQKAMSLAPTQSCIYSTLGAFSLKLSDLKLSQQLIDQSLMLDPGNWNGLWSKYKLLKMQGKTKQLSLVAAQMRHYFPGVPEVMTLK